MQHFWFHVKAIPTPATLFVLLVSSQAFEANPQPDPFHSVGLRHLLTLSCCSILPERYDSIRCIVFVGGGFVGPQIAKIVGTVARDKCSWRRGVASTCSPTFRVNTGCIPGKLLLSCCCPRNPSTVFRFFPAVG